MKKFVYFLMLLVSSAVTASAEMDGSLPMYPHGRNMNDMPAAAVAKRVPIVLETEDAVQAVDAWYTSNAPKTCIRSAEKQGVKYACPGGNVMIYSKGKTQVALIPSMRSFFGH